MDAARPARRGTLAAAAGLTLISFCSVAVHIARGGFYLDDWSNAAGYHFESSPQYLHGVADQVRALGSRPILAALLPVPHAVFGAHPGSQIAFGAALAAAMCFSFFVFLRTVGLSWLPAFGVAGLVLIYPWSDSIRFISTWSLNTVAITFALMGATLSLRAFRVGRHPFGGARVAALVLFAASVLTYEMAAAALLLLGLLYVKDGPRRPAVRWWAADAAVVLTALVFEGLATTRDVPTLAQRLYAIPSYTKQSLAIFSLMFVPPRLPAGRVTDAFEALALLAVALVVALSVRRFRRTRDPTLGWLLGVLGCAVIAVVAGYVGLLGTYLRPALPGDGNRANLFAALGYAALVYVILSLAGRLVPLAPSRRDAVVVCAFVLVGVNFAVRFAGDGSWYDRAAVLQRPVVAEAVSYSRSLPDGSAIFTFGSKGTVSLGVPVFRTSYDLDGAVMLWARRASIHAYPMIAGTTLTCGPTGLTADLPAELELIHSSYGSTYFLDLRSLHRRDITSQQVCRRSLPRFLAAIDAN